MSSIHPISPSSPPSVQKIHMIEKKDHSFSSGQIYNNFVVVKARFIPELRCTLRELVHLPSGAAVMHIDTQDPENFFCLSFQTLPTTSNGIAHVLEHTVLCGSKKYPVKDPFFSMTRRSLNTFMNAMTGSDVTFYPAATQNEKDFYNLLSVYTDAVFHPNLDILSFAQEGHRLEFSNIQDTTSTLLRKGVVYNEMKGAMSSPHRRLYDFASHALFPESTYGKNSGGEPAAIPTLTLQELKEFHKKYYHPSTCLFFFYGNIALEKHLDFLEREVFSDKDASRIQSPEDEKTDRNIIQQRFTAPIAKTVFYPLDNIEDKEYLDYYSLSWLTTSIQNQLDCLSLSLLDTILMGTDAGLLKKALLESGLCRQATSALDREIAQIPYTLTLSGMNAKDAAALKQVIFSTLEKIAKEGIPDRLLQGALHQLELERSEIMADGTPFGLTLYLRVALLAHHGSDPLWGLTIHSLFDKIRSKIEQEPEYISNLIKTHFLDNPHMVEITMLPSLTLAQEENEQERRTMQEINAHLSESEKSAIVQQSELLQQRQDLDEDISCLPCISISDVAPKVRSIALHVEHITRDGGQEEEEKEKEEQQQYHCEKNELDSTATRTSSYCTTNVYSHEAFTNGLTYLDVAIPLPQIEEDEIWLVRLASTLLPQLGAKDRKYDQMLEEIILKTGGISTSLNLHCKTKSPKEFHPAFHIHGKALDKNVEDLFCLVTDMLTHPRLDDTKRIQDLVEKHYTNLTSSLSSSALHYSTTSSSRHTHKAAALYEKWYGVSYYKKIQELVQHYDEKKQLFLEQLEKVLQKMLTKSRKIDVIVTAQKETHSVIQKKKLWGLPRCIKKEIASFNSDIVSVDPHSSDTSIEIYFFSQPISYTSMTTDAISYDHPDSAFLSIAATLMDNTVLHRRIREQGGAYGSGAVFRPGFATFQFYSYRDPHITSTIQAFHEAIQSIADGKFDDDDVQQAKLEILQSLDAPLPPGSLAITAYDWLQSGKTDKMRQWYKDSIIHATADQIQKAVKTHLIEKKPVYTIVCCTGKELYEQEKPSLTATGLTIVEKTAVH